MEKLKNKPPQKAVFMGELLNLTYYTVKRQLFFRKNENLKPKGNY
jgi:hypothetical protein